MNDIPEADGGPTPPLLRRVFGWVRHAGPSLGSAFSRERRAVQAGIRRYHEIEGSHQVNRSLLRRNIHRLEKGLMMRPRRETFAVDYIRETVDAFVRATQQREAGSSGVHEGEWTWAHDVLAAYFEVTGPHATIDRERERFRKLCAEVHTAGEARPYLRTCEDAPPVSYEDLLLLAKRRRSVRWYQNKPVPRDLVDKALLVATQAPSACNRQPFSYRIFDDPDKVRNLASLPMGTRGFSHNFPMIAAVVGSLRAYFSPRDRHLIYIDGSLSAMGFMLALETLGLSSCPINWPDIEEREEKVCEFLRLEPDERVVMLISIGYPDPTGLVAFSHKKGVDELRTFNL